MSDIDNRFMALALSLGARGMGRVWPNPAVGCVIVRDGRIVGRGWTQDGGRPHGEVMALRQAGDLARGATVYVTLEPCSHHGKTPPCAEALIGAGVARVVSAIEDTDPRVAGRGHDMLRAAGITVDVGCLAEKARAAHVGFFTRLAENRPFVTLKLAMTLDGRIATQTGESQWITGPEARRHVHAMRMRHDAVLVGAGTARADDPTLNVRGFGDVPQPVRVVASRNLDIPLASKLTATAKDVPLWLVHGAAAPDMMTAPWAGIGARLFAARERQGAIDPIDMMAQLAEAGLTRVFCEGGGQLGSSLLSHGLVDEVVVMNAGVAIGAEGQAGLGPMGITRLADAPRFERVECRALGDDIMHRWRRV